MPAMSAGDGTNSHRTETEKMSPSPARNSLKGNLSVISPDAEQKLRKKKSWMSSIRDAVSKGALQAKAAVDSFRGDQQKVEPQSERICSTPEPRRSLDDLFTSKAHTASLSTPPRKSHGRQLSLRPKATTGSLRQRLHAKRDSLLSSTTRQSFDSEASIVGSENFVTPPLSAQDDKKHETLAKTIVGSLRGMRHRYKKNDALAVPPTTDPITTDDDLPPSSPVDIPSAAPALANLDFGATGFELSPPTLVGSRLKDEHTGFLPSPRPQHAKSDGNVTGRSSRGPKILDSSNIHTRRHPIAPRDILKLHFADDLKAPGEAPAPAARVPGTDLALEIDGAWATNTELFERAVTPADENERQKLRSMRSLDAMAEACITTTDCDHEADTTLYESPVDIDTTCPSAADLETMDDGTSAAGSPILPLSAKTQGLKPTARRNLASAETVHTIPSSMSELTRQNSPHTSIVDITPEGFEDPFADRHALNFSPPSPDRSVRLPFRPKRHSHEQSLAELEDGPLEPVDPDSRNGADAPSATSSANLQDSLEEQLELQRTYAISERLDHVEHRDTRRNSSQESDPFVSVGSDDDTATRAQELLTSDIILPNYDNLVSDHDDGMSPHGGPLASTFGHMSNNISNNDSPRSIRSRSTYTAGLGDAQYVFSFDNWLRDSSGATSPDQPITPDRRRMDVSLDSVSDAESRSTPAVSLSTSTPNRHTLDLGHAPEFVLRRAQRNMRYNALQVLASNGTVVGHLAAGRNATNFIVGGSDEISGDGIQFPSFDNAYRSSPDNGTQRNDGAIQTRVGSDESVAESIRNAARDYNQLQEQLNEPQDVFADPVESLEQRFRLNCSATPSPVKGQRKDPVFKTLSSPDSGYQADASSTGAGVSSPFVGR